MAHELTQRADGSYEFAYLEGAVKPWHGLGNPVPEGADRETWCKASGLDWKAQRAFVRYRTGVDANDPESWGKVADRVVLFRSDTKTHLGIVSDDYEIVQPAAVMDFFHDMARGHGFTMETAGSLFGGRKIFALARAGDDAYVVDRRDAVRPYLLCATSLDGSMATETRKTAVQVVCHNTMTMARSEKGAEVIKVRHSTKWNPAMVRAELGIEFQRDLADYVARMRKLATVKVPDEAAQAATVALFKGLDAARDRKSKEFREAANSQPVREVLQRYMTGGRHAGMDGVQGTAYGWFNAVTEYVDHAAQTRGKEFAADRRTESAWFGKGAERKEKALEFAGILADSAPSSVAMPGATGPDLYGMFGLKRS